MKVSRPPRVVHIVPSLFAADGQIIGGAERYVLELARHMADQTPTRLVSFGGEDRQFRDKNLDVRILGRPWHVRGNRFNPLSTRLFGEALRADVVHCHQQFVWASSLTALCARLTGRRVFCTDLGGAAWDVSAYVSTDSWYHGHLHISRFSRTIYRHDANPRAHWIYGGVDAAKFSPPPESPRAVPTALRGPGILVTCPRKAVGMAPKGSAPALFVGRLLPHKGVNYLIEGLPPGVPLHVVGGAFDTAYYQLLQRLAQSKNVCFTLRCTDDELVAAYRSALCIVLPSVYKSAFGQESRVPELLGQTLLEGMACGLPAICTAVGGMPEVVQDGATGFVVPPNDPAALGDKIAWLREHPAEARPLGAAARRRVLEHFTWPATVQRCLEVYRRWL